MISTPDSDAQKRSITASSAYWPPAAMGLLLIIGLGLALYIILHSKIEQQVATDQELVTITLESVLEQEHSRAEMFFHRDINIPTVQRLMFDAKHGDEAQQGQARDSLYWTLIGEYSYRVQNTNLRQLHFHTRDNRSFLRFHRPGKFGDDLSDVRETIAHTNAYLQPVKGFEEGRIFNGYRFVFPIFHQNEHVGSVETSVSMGAVTSTLSRILDSPASFVVKKTIVEDKLFSNELSNYIASPAIEDFLFDRELGGPAESFVNGVQNSHMGAAKIREQLLQGEIFSDYAQFEGTYYITHYYPIFNELTGVLAAYVITVREHPYLWETFQQLVLLFVTISALIAIGILLFMRLRVAKQDLTINNLILERIQEVANVGTWTYDIKEDRLIWSAEVYRMFGRNRDEEINLETFYSAVHPEDFARVLAEFTQCVNDKRDYSTRHRIVTPDGDVRHLAENGIMVFDSAGNVSQVMGMAQDVTEYSTLISQLNQFIDSQENIIFAVENQGHAFCNKAFYRFFNFMPQSPLVEPKTLPSVFEPLDGCFTPDQALKNPWWDQLDVLSTAERTVAILHPSHGMRYFRVSISLIEKRYRVVSLWDITDSVEEVRTLSEKATRDPLTQAFNREYMTGFMERLNSSMSSKRFGLILLDVDHFKEINDQHGHPVGDQVLKKLVERVQSQIRTVDFVVRWGGEEFLVVIDDVDTQAARVIAEKLRTAIEEYDFDIGKRVTSSFGVTSFKASDDLNPLLVRADRALYLAKSEGRNRVRIASDES